MPSSSLASPRRLLVCDDDAVFADEVSALAAASGIEARIAGSASAFIALLDRFTPDVVVMDLHLPGADGVALARQALRSSQAPRLIFTSAMGGPALRAACSIAESSGYAEVYEIEKPIDARRLRQLLLRRSDLKSGGRPDDFTAAFAASAFELHYQPILDLVAGRIGGAEGLARWRHPSEGVLSPARFLKRLTQSGHLHMLTTVAVEEGLAHLAAWRRGGHDLSLSLNVPVSSLMQAGFADWLMTRVRRAGLPPGTLILELTESEARADQPAIIDTLLRLRMEGVGIALDDFGTGFASLQDLWQMPLTHAKIDRYFLQQSCRDKRGARFFKSIVGICRNLDLSVCSEGVETLEELRFVQEAGCQHAQGFKIGPPLPPSAFDDLLRAVRAPDRVAFGAIGLAAN